MEHGRYASQDVLTLKNSCSQPYLHHCRYLVIDLVKIRDADIVKLTLYDICMYMKLAIILFLFTLEHCIEHVYFRAMSEYAHGQRKI